MPAGGTSRTFRSPYVLVALFILLLPAITSRLNASDEIEYFAWLRSWAFDRDADFTNEYQHFYDAGPVHNEGFYDTFLAQKNENGRPNNFTPIGTAILWAPFYAVGHLWATLGGGGDEGYGPPYIQLVALASACYGLLALLLSCAVAARVLGTHALIPALVVWFGTPLIFYMYVAPGFGHACSAFSVALFLWTWVRVRDRWTWAGAFQLGAAGALLPMVREQDAFFLAGPAIDFVRWTLRQRGSGITSANPVARPPAERSWRAPIAAAIAGLVACVLVYAPQLAAYQALNGHPGPATVVARKMSWSSPHFFGVILSPEHGFFVWTPLAVLAIAGLVRLVARGATSDREAGEGPIVSDPRWVGTLGLLMVLLQFYISGSVESWTVAGSFGQRRMIALTPLVVLGLAALMQGWRHRAGLRAGLAISLVIATWWNLGLMAQFGLHTMDRQRLTLRENAQQTFIELPRSLPSVVWRYLFHRDSFYGLPASPPSAAAGRPD